MTDEDGIESSLIKMRLGELEINLQQIAQEREKLDVRFGNQSYKPLVIESNPGYILSILPKSVFRDILLFVNQYDLYALLLVNREIYELATDKLYERVCVQLQPKFPLKYHGDRRKYVEEAGLKYMNTSIIFDLLQVLQFAVSLKVNPKLISKFKLFIFEHYYEGDFEAFNVQSKLYKFFGKYCTDLKFMNIAFTNFTSNFNEMIEYLSKENIRRKIYKLFVLEIDQLYKPIIPKNVTNLYLILNENDLIDDNGNRIFIDLAQPQFQYLNSLQRLTCGTVHDMGLEVLKAFKLRHVEEKLKLNGLNINHLHNEDILELDFIDLRVADDHFNEFQKFVKSLDKRLNFSIISDRIELSYLTHLTLKIECISLDCICFQTFIHDWVQYFRDENPNSKIKSLTLERFSNIPESPEYFLSQIIEPMGQLINCLNSLENLFIDFQTPGFKNIATNDGSPPLFFNRFDDNYLENIFLKFFPPLSLIRKNLKVLQIDDFFLSFIYYKTEFLNSILHTCKCWGCHLVLEKLEELFHPHDENSNNHNNGILMQTTYYSLLGYVLLKLQTDRQVFTPIKDTTSDWNEYPMYPGNPHTLHCIFHRYETPETMECHCNLDGPQELFIDNLVTIYLVHQTIPITKYIKKILPNLTYLMINGIYWEYDHQGKEFVTTFDDMEYPRAHLQKYELNPDSPPGPFGQFRKHRESIMYDF
jgi:hypothetical protein